MAVAYLFCNYNEQDHQSAIDLVKSVLSQLAILSRFAKNEGSCTVLSGLQRKHESHRTEPLLAEYVQAVKTLAADFDRVYIVVDAMDELTDEACRLFVRTTVQLVRDDVVVVLVTSRPIQTIWNNFCNGMKTTTKLEIMAAVDDVEAYVGHELQERWELQDLVADAAVADPDLAKKIIQQVSEKASGM